MSSNNNGEAMIGILLLAMLGAAAVLMVAVFAFAALVLTLAAIAAWEKPIVLFGDVIEPDAARAYVLRGILGAGLAPVFVVFSAFLFQFSLNGISGHGWLLILIGGYSLGSLGVEILIDEMRREAAGALPPVILQPLPPQEKAPPAVKLPREQPFRFASWDDEEEISQ